MPPRVLPDQLRAFIRDSIPTMEHADLLVRLMRIAPATTTVAEAAAAASLPAHVVERCFDHLVAAGVSARQAQDGETRYAYAPKDAQEQHRCDLLLSAYVARPVALVREVFERPPM